MANEKRLIDANALMDKIEGVNWYHIDKLGYLASGANSQEHTPMYKAEDIYNTIRNAPTIHAVEVIHAEWGEIYTCHGERLWGYKCSRCEHDNSTKSNYCPNCGAKMDAKE